MKIGRVLNNENIICSLMINTVVLGFGISANAVEDAEPVPRVGSVVVTENGNRVSSDATISVEAGENITLPIDGNKPAAPTNDKGPLSIDQVIIFAFEGMKLSGGT